MDVKGGFVVPEYIAPAMIKAAKVKRHIKGKTLRFTHIPDERRWWTLEVEKVDDGE